MTSFSAIRSRDHNLLTLDITKVGLCAFDDKRYVLEDNIHACTATLCVLIEVLFRSTCHATHARTHTHKRASTDVARLPVRTATHSCATCAVLVACFSARRAAAAIIERLDAPTAAAAAATPPAATMLGRGKVCYRTAASPPCCCPSHAATPRTAPPAIPSLYLAARARRRRRRRRRARARQALARRAQAQARQGACRLAYRARYDRCVLFNTPSRRLRRCSPPRSRPRRPSPPR